MFSDTLWWSRVFLENPDFRESITKEGQKCAANEWNRQFSALNLKIDAPPAPPPLAIQ